MFQHYVTCSVSAVMLWCLALCSVSTTAIAGEEEFADTVRAFDFETHSVERFYYLSWSYICQERLIKMYSSWQDQLTKVDFDNLNQEGRIDWLLLREKLTYELARIERDRADLAQIDELVPFRSIIEHLEVSRWKKIPSDPPAAAAALSQIPEQIKLIRQRLEKGRKANKKAVDDKPENQPAQEVDDATAIKPTADAVSPDDDNTPLKTTPLLAWRTARTLDSIRQALKQWHQAYAGTQPDFEWWMQKPVEEAQKSLEAYGKYLREEIAHIKGKDEDPLLGEPLGESGLKRDLAAEFLPYSAQELLAIGEAEFARSEEYMKAAAQSMNFGDDWHAALAKVKGDYVPPGKQGDFIVEKANEAAAFVKKNDLVTVPELCEETWRISMISTDKQRQLPYVAYNSMHILAAYARDDMSNEDKLMSMRGNNQHFTRITTAHELIPGHHLQGYFGNRFREYRSAFRTPFFVEGWALYWEMALWDHGYAQTPEDKIGMLFWRMHRAARIIVTLKFHLGQMTPEEMVNFLIERVGHERSGAVSEVRRFIDGDFAPLYQCGYMIGGLQLRALAKEMTAGGKMTTKQFNDAVLRLGTIPIEMIRASLMGLPLTKSTKSEWRFGQ